MGRSIAPLYWYSPSWIGYVVLSNYLTAKPSNCQYTSKSNPWRHRFWVGCPLPPIPGLRGKFYDASTRVDEPYNEIGVWGLHQIFYGLDEHAALHDEFEGDGWHDEG